METKARTEPQNREYPNSQERKKKTPKTKVEEGTSFSSAGDKAIVARKARKRQKEVLVAVATYNVRTLAVKGKNAYGHDERVLAKGPTTWL